LSRALWSFLYLGYNPVLPGTAGSLGGLLIYLVAQQFPGAGLVVPVCAAILFAAAVWGGRLAESYYDEKDPRPCVVDEGCGVLVSLIGIATVPIWHGAVLGFLLFRLYDVLKPFPVRRLERLEGGWGIAMDDVAAGVYANVSVRVLLWALGSVL